MSGGNVRNAMYWDLEGPISSMDHAALLCKRHVLGGDKLFPVMSRFDDILALDNKEGYEPGDTLMLQIPFLVEAGVTEKDLRVLSAEAGLVPGVDVLFSSVREQGCAISIISTSYEQHALAIAARVKVSLDRVYCTKFPLDQFRENIGQADLQLIREIRKKATALYHEELDSGVNDEEIQKLLNPFFWEQLPKTPFGQIMATMSVMGGRRKVGALEQAVRTLGGYLSDAFVVADSITDFRMAQVVEAAGGIALVWNGNQYIIPFGSCGVAAVNSMAIAALFQAWLDGGRPAVREAVESMPKPHPETGPYYHWLAGRDPEFHSEVLAIHKRLRTVCRGAETAKLG